MGEKQLYDRVLTDLSVLCDYIEKVQIAGAKIGERDLATTFIATATNALMSIAHYYAGPKNEGDCLPEWAEI